MRGIQLAAFLLPLIALPACTETAPASTAALSSEQRSELIERLQAAKKLDWQYAVDPNVTPVTEEDFLDQMNSADRVVKELTYGLDVPQQEIAEALWVPPKSITSENGID
jgi:DNA-directed RNA polymerase specialized sigma24 family protein